MELHFSTIFHGINNFTFRSMIECLLNAIRIIKNILFIIVNVTEDVRASTCICIDLCFVYSVAPDLVPPGDICLGGSLCGERMGYHDVCRSFKCSPCADHVFGAVLSGILMSPDNSCLGNTTRSDMI